jgi:RecA-family ATPase
VLVNPARQRPRSGVKADEGDDQADNDLRELQFLKNQYGPRGETLALRYQRGLFLPERGVGGLDKIARAAQAESSNATSNTRARCTQR